MCKKWSFKHQNKRLRKFCLAKITFSKACGQKLSLICFRLKKVKPLDAILKRNTFPPLSQCFAPLWNISSNKNATRAPCNIFMTLVGAKKKAKTAAEIWDFLCFPAQNINVDKRTKIYIKAKPQSSESRINTALKI